MVRRIARPLIGRVNIVYAAKTIEISASAFKNSLINYMYLRRHREDCSKSFYSAVEAKAVKDLTQVEVDTVVNQRRLLQMAYALSGVVVVFCLYAALTPKDILASAKRSSSSPTSSAPPIRPSRTSSPAIPASYVASFRGRTCRFQSRFRGATSERGQAALQHRRRQVLRGGELRSRRNYYDPWQTELRDLRQSLDYYLTGGDAESLKYHLEVVPAPMVTSVVLDYEFPSYTKVPPRKNVEGGHIEALEGTTVTVRARTNEPAASAYFDFSQRDKNAKNGNSGRLEVDPADAHVLTGTIRVQESGSYTIKFKTTGGQLNPDPVVYDIKALPDLPPSEVAFLKPDKPEVTVPSNVNVPILATAADDFGIRDALLYVRIGHEPQTSVNLLDKQPPTRRFKGLSTIELASKKLKPGTHIEYWLQVHDTKEPRRE